MLPVEVTGSAKADILGIVRAAHLSRTSEGAVLDALGGRSRVLPEGKPSPCAALTFLSFSSAAGDESLQATPAVAAMEMLMAAGDLIDDIQDGEAGLPDDRHSLGQVLEIVSLLLMLAHRAIGSLAEKGVPASRVLTGLRVFDTLGVDALRGQTLDMDLETRQDVSIEDSIAASRLKSASLTRCAAELGASLGTDDAGEIERYGQFGWHFGLLMQLMNDVAAVWPGAREKSDLRLRKKTLPITFALNLPRGSSRHAHVIQSYYESNGTPRSSELEVKWALWSCGAIHYAWIVAAREKAKAQEIGRTLAGSSLGTWPLTRLLN